MRPSRMAGPFRGVVSSEERPGSSGGMVVMRATSKVVALMVVLGLGAIPFFVGLGGVRAQDMTSPARSARGGTLTRSAHYQFEVFFYPTGVRVFEFDADGSPVTPSALSGTATFYYPNSPRPWFSRPLNPASVPPGLRAESLDMAMDLSTVPRSGTMVAFEVRGLAGPDGPISRFTMPFTLVDSGPASSTARQAARPVPSAKVPVEQARYYPVAGFYRLSSGALIWVPSPGYYYGEPVQYHRHRRPTGASDHEAARRGPDTDQAVAAPRRQTAKPTGTELYWRPRAFGGAKPGGAPPTRSGSGSKVQ
jgi:hypothetical protein